MSITRPEQPCSTNTLVPRVSRKTLAFRHRKHHHSCVDNLNKAIDSQSCKSPLLKAIDAAVDVAG
ncbi:MAG: hypothetical protein P8M18_12540 [Woeseiaceae bacterium]|nr:hypothetical protein [Woeseiaceae bacterium]